MKMKMQRIPFSAKATKLYGGLDIVTPMLEAKPGTCRKAYNVFQLLLGGYSTMFGYERYSGQPSPSSAVFYQIQVNITGAINVGDSIDNNAGASGIVIAVDGVNIYYTKSVGSFSVGNPVRVGGASQGTVTSKSEAMKADTEQNVAKYAKLSADLYRSDIGRVPGSGPIRGLFYYAGKWYAFRDDAIAGNVILHVESASGWVQVPFLQELSFTSGGVYDIKDGDVITGHTSGATATIHRAVTTTGSMAGGDAAGILVITGQVGNFVAETLDIGAHTDVATIAGNSSDISMVSGGTFEFDDYNFTGSIGTRRIYGCDGKNRAFEFDGTAIVPIPTGMPIDTPEHMYCHNNQLFLSFKGSAQHSAPGTPFEFSLVFGADELAVGDQITGFIAMPGTEAGDALAIFSRNSINMLYGTNVTDYKLVSYKAEAGAVARSMQKIGNVFMLDDRGIVKLKTTQMYGNFVDATESQRLQTLIDGMSNKLNDSLIVREKNLYWLFFDDMSSYCCTVDNGNIVAIFPEMMGKNIKVATSAEIDNGTEMVMFGDSDGYVYHWSDASKSFDSSSIPWLIDLNFNHFGSPLVYKDFRQALLEAKGSGYSEYAYTYAIEYDDVTVRNQPITLLFNEQYSPGSWDLGGKYDSGGKWDSRSLKQQMIRLLGSGTNISHKLYGNNAYSSPLRFSGIITQFNMGRERR